MSIHQHITLLLLLFSLFACGQKKQKTGETNEQENLPNYSLHKPEVFTMPGELEEISGIAFLNGNADTVFAEQDEEGKLFRFALGSEKLIETKFGKKGDYEDVQVSNGYVIMLRSDGVLFTFPLSQINQEKAGDVKEFSEVLPDGEYEGLYADAATGSLYVLCKHCNEKQTETNTGYVLQLTKNGDIKPDTTFTIDVKEIAAKAGVKKLLFEPSALAKNRATNEWFILSSVNKIVIVANSNWSVKNIYRLDESLYNQPEGIAFDKDNNLYISNEKGNTKHATILKLSYQK